MSGTTSGTTSGRRATGRVAAARAAGRAAGLAAWLVALGAWTVLRVVVVTAGRVAVFAAEVADELVTARMGCPAVVPRVRRGWSRLVQEWRAWRADVLEAEVVEEVWR